ncbi:hypothetical protein M409DRAFT_63982 [Zasmidium cellare ATCC 36951]|uniref:Heterokaryon incompatibility domain-containing protein n=1 Tax=Zasmidium cellare ATCC 36951 TaxID=1080233 RepID=A0A6A6CXP7_ZASCE|nr:uncharacterized protein M409DRAFT_63982 [Zasmidium cellare ATCC 36951]KAF2170980.1 hypothetical protein M409DRAFT_63982 [Zasmidium cellare ATCC 36951]
MRLLNIRTLELREFRVGGLPKYVIASHRWITDQEAKYKDVQERQNTDTLGYLKVKGFAQYVQNNIPEVGWLWIDTCCIDKSSSQEVSEAINSMFRWYSEAEVCLAYLSDVDTLDVEDFILSEWFTRGWTLQELLAPSMVVFLAKDWRIIDFEQSRSLDVDEKIAWTSGRKTTRDEDMSYCLFGILDVTIGANYGEGGDKARRRLLRELAENRHIVAPIVGHCSPQRQQTHIGTTWSHG